MILKIVQEGEVAARVSKRGQIFDESDLHFCAGQLHTFVPSEALLAFYEENLWILVGQSASFELVVQGDSEGKI